MKIGIIGIGFVGSAVLNAFKKSVSYQYDKFKNINLGNIHETDFIFICLPTPTVNGIQNLDSIEENLESLVNDGYKGAVVIKSTVLPGTCRYLSIRYPDLKIIHNPEFLCEKTAKEDFLNQETVLISAVYKEDALELSEFYEKNLKASNYYIHTKYETTEWAKYIHNCILPVKLSFLNEVFREMNNQKEFNLAIQMASKFGNIGNHSNVPGPDGKLGWGGSCFTKDTEALSTQYPDLITLKAAIESNKKVRK